MARGAIWHTTGGSGGALLPYGAIVAFKPEKGLPSNFTLLNPNRFIRCGLGTTGGSYSCGSTGSGGGGNHGSVNGSRFMRDPNGSANWEISSVVKNMGNHTHTVNMSYTPGKSGFKLIQNETEEGAMMPAGSIFFSANTKVNNDIPECAVYSNGNSTGHYLFGVNTDAGATLQGGSKSVSSKNSSFSHLHHDTANDGSGGPFGPHNSDRPQQGPSHNHSCSASWSVSVYAYVLKAFRNKQDNYAYPDSIIMMPNNIEHPEGWLYCDGTNGTPNLHERFIRFAGSSGDGVNTAEGTGNFSVSGSLSNAGSHNHQSSLSGNEWQKGYAHNNNVSHGHSYSKSGGYTPEYQDYKFLMREE